MANPSTFSIREMTGDKRSIELRGRALPYQPFTLEGSMRVEVTRYPGNPIATAQVIGAEEKQTTVNGQWKNRFISPIDSDGREVTPTGVALIDGQQAGDALQLVRAVDAIRLAGQLLEVTWDELTRRGFLIRLRQAWQRREDVEWEMEFDWISRGEDPSPVTFPLTPATQEFADQMRPYQITLQNILESAPFEVVASFTASINTYLADIESAITQIDNAASNVVGQVLSPLGAAERTLAAAVTLRDSGAGIATTVEEIPARSVVNVADVTSLTFGDTLLADEFTRDLKRTAKQMEAAAAEQGNTIRALISQDDLLGTFVARADMDLRDVASQFYGAQEEWRRLMSFNGLTSSRLIAGDLVMVPKLQQATGEG